MKIKEAPTRMWATVVGAMTIALLFVAWQISSTWFATAYPERSIFFPGPRNIAGRALEMLQSPSFWTAVGITNLRVVAGFLVAAVLAIPLGLVLGAYPKLEAISGPVTDFGRYLPVAALVPLTIVWVGVGDFQKVLVLAMGTFFQMLVMVTDAVKRVPASHVDTALTLGCQEWMIASRVLLPASMPQIFDACRVGVGLTWSYLLLAEVVASENGLGYVIIRSQRFLETDRIFFVIIVLGFLGLAYDRMFAVSRRFLFRWAHEEAGAV